jgi:hypothetical protein
MAVLLGLSPPLTTNSDNFAQEFHLSNRNPDFSLRNISDKACRPVIEQEIMVVPSQRRDVTRDREALRMSSQRRGVENVHP